MAHKTGFIVVSTSYRKAPENPYPAAVLDVSSTLKWIQSEQIRQFGGDPSKIYLLGSSAGGNLAAAVVALNYDVSQTPVKQRASIKGLVTIYPPLEHGVLRDSHFRYSQVNGLLSLKQMLWFWNLYLPEEEQNCRSYTACPLRTPQSILKHFPPTAIVLAKFDVLLDEGIEFGRRLKSYNVPVDVQVYNSTIHGFFARYSSGMEALQYVVGKLLEYNAIK